MVAAAIAPWLPRNQKGEVSSQRAAAPLGGSVLLPLSWECSHPQQLRQGFKPQKMGESQLSLGYPLGLQQVRGSKSSAKGLGPSEILGPSECLILWPGSGTQLCLCGVTEPWQHPEQEQGSLSPLASPLALCFVLGSGGESPAALRSRLRLHRAGSCSNNLRQQNRPCPENNNSLSSGLLRAAVRRHRDQVTPEPQQGGPETAKFLQIP